jgi:peptidyl-prolyl cis-trans isomerase
MKADINRRIAVSYTLTVEGKVEDSASSENPLSFVLGLGQLLPGFEEAVLGKEVGESFEVVLRPEDGYGIYQEANKVELPIDIFTVDGKVMTEMLEIGRTLPMQTTSGHTMMGKILRVTPEIVEMDFNHPLAGKTLHFTGKVELVEEVSPEELEEMQSHHSCGCCGGDCDEHHHEDGGCCGGHHHGDCEKHEHAEGCCNKHHHHDD